MPEAHKHLYNYSDRNQTVIGCPCGQKQVLKPLTRNLTLAGLARAGEWAGADFAIEAKELLDNPPANPQGTLADPPVAGVGSPVQVPTIRPPQKVEVTPSTDLVVYQTPEGQQVSLSVSIFRQMICPEADEGQSRYMLGWCEHNRIDPYGNEAYFSVIQNKPVIMVSKDCWLRRMERHPKLSHYDSGLTVEIGAKRLQSAILGGMGDDYLIAPELRALLIQALVDGKLSIPGGLEGRLVVRKRGQYLGQEEMLEGAWCKIWRTDRPEPLLFELNAKGWSKDNSFWKSMGPFMMWKTGLKNAVRQAFPELSGLIAQREAPDALDAAEVADAEFTARCTTEQLRMLHGAGSKVSPPVGPLRHPQLHDLATINYDGRGLAELTVFEMSQLIDLIQHAAEGDPETLAAIESDLTNEKEIDYGSPEEPDEQPDDTTDALLF